MEDALINLGGGGGFILIENAPKHRFCASGTPCLGFSNNEVLKTLVQNFNISGLRH